MGPHCGPDHIRRMRLDRLVHHQAGIDQAALDDVARDHLGPDLAGEFLDLGAGQHPHEPRRHPLHTFHGVVCPGHRRLSVRFWRFWRRWHGVAHDVGHRGVGLVEVGVGKVAGDARKPLHPGDLLDAGFHPPSLVALRHPIEDLLGVGGPLDLEAVEGFLLLDAAFASRHRDHRGLVDRLEAGPLANRTGIGPLDAGRLATSAADPGLPRLLAVHRRLRTGRLDAHGAGGMLGHHLGDREVDDRRADDRVAALHRVAADGRAGDRTKSGRHLLHSRLRLLGPGHAGLRLDVDRRHVAAAGEQDADRRQAQQVIGVAAQVHLGRRVDANSPHDEQPGRVLPDVLQHFFEGFAVEERGLDLDALIPRHRLGDPQVRFVDLRQPGVDDLLVQLLLLLEAKDLGGLRRKNVDDAVEHRVVQVGVVDRDGLHLFAEDACQLDGGAKTRE